MNILKLPGTVVEMPADRYSVRDVLNSMFLAGGLMLSQVSSLTGLSTHVLQNWVKRRFVSSPYDKKYNKNQFCRIVILNLLKEGMQLEHITKLLECINRGKDPDAGKEVSEFETYCIFVDIMIHSEMNVNNLPTSIQLVMDGYPGPYQGWKKNATQIFRIMGILYICSVLKDQAGMMLEELHI